MPPPNAAALLSASADATAAATAEATAAALSASYVRACRRLVRNTLNFQALQIRVGAPPGGMLNRSTPRRLRRSYSQLR